VESSAFATYLDTEFATYLDKGVFTVSPFETIVGVGVGRLVKIAVEEGRRTKPRLKFWVCGEHGGDPESIHFFHTVGLDFVSWSPSSGSKPDAPPSAEPHRVILLDPTRCGRSRPDRVNSTGPA